MRTDLGERMDEALEAEESSCWKQLCQISLETAVEVLGTKPRNHPRPWLDGREQDLQILDEEVESHKEMDRRARVNREIEVVRGSEKGIENGL